MTQQYVQPYGTNTLNNPSLAAYKQMATVGNQAGINNLSGANTSLAQAQVTPQTDLPFFNGGSVMENVNSGMNLVGSGVSLVGMLQNMRDARKNNSLNRNNIRQQMDQSETAFNRDVARQNSTMEGIAERDKRVAEMNQ